MTPVKFLVWVLELCQLLNPVDALSSRSFVKRFRGYVKTAIPNYGCPFVQFEGFKIINAS